MFKLLFIICFTLSLNAFDSQLLTQLGEVCQLPSESWMQPGKERWMMKDCCEDRRKEALEILRSLGCLDAIHAKMSQYDYALVFGALSSRVQRRLDFLHAEWQRGVRFDAIIFLTGQRDIEKEREELPEGVASETQMMIRLYRSHPLSQEARDLPLVVIDTSKQFDHHGSLRRPNTADTVKAWLKTHPQPGKCLAVSDQPFVCYQDAVIRSLLPEEFSVETVGAADTGNLPISVYLDNLAKTELATSSGS